MPGEWSPDEIRAMQHPDLAETLERLGVRILPTAGGRTIVHVPPEHEEYVRQRVASDTGDEQSVTADDFLGGLPYLRDDYETAGKLNAANKMTIKGIQTRRKFSTKRAYRIYRQFRHGAVLYDDAGGLRPGPGYQWDPFAFEHDPPQYLLIRR